MIKLTKTKIPQILQNNAAAWTEDLMAFVRRGEKVPVAISGKYNHDEIKSALKLETASKCMYCEGKVAHVAYEHIEHIKPKAPAKFPELTFDWLNLGLACPVCNVNKGDNYDNALPFLNPYADDPGQYLFASGPYVFSKPGQLRGEITERGIKLNRVELVEQRLERITAIRQLINKYETETNVMLKGLILQEIKIEMGADKPYSLVINSFISIIEASATV